MQPDAQHCRYIGPVIHHEQGQSFPAQLGDLPRLIEDFPRVMPLMPKLQNTGAAFQKRLGSIYICDPQARQLSRIEHGIKWRNDQSDHDIVKGKPMKVELERAGEICTLRLEGRFATGQDTEYLHTKTEELKNAGCRHIIADFSKVSYIDSTGIGFLIAIYTSVLRDHGQFVLSAPNRRVRDVLDLTKLSSILKLYESELAARTALTERPS